MSRTLRWRRWPRSSANSALTARSAYDEAERLRQAIADAEEARDRDVAGLADLEHRLERSRTVDEMEPDHAERDRLAEQARLARSAEMDARLALRTLRSGHVRWLVEPMRCAGRLKANGKRASARSLAASDWCEARTAAAVHAGATFLADLLERSLATAARERSEAEAMRTDAEAALAGRASVRALTRDFESFVDAAHRDEIARAEQQMRVEALQERAMAELGLEAEVLLAEYGRTSRAGACAWRTAPHSPARTKSPSLCRTCERQEKRLRTAERELSVLGRVNPLALEEFDALKHGTSSSPSNWRTCARPVEIFSRSSSRLTTGCSRSSRRPTPTSRLPSSACSHGSSPAEKAG